MGTRNPSSAAPNLTFLDSLLAHVAILDEQGIILAANEAWTSFDSESTAITRAEVGVNYFDVLQKAVALGNDYALKFILGLKEVMAGDTSSYTLTYPLKTSGDSLWFKLTVRPCNDTRSQFIMINEDITSGKRAERKLRESRDRYQIQFEQSLDGILITDTQGHILEANPAAGKILGWDRQTLTTNHRRDIIDTDDPNYQRVLKNLEESGSFRLETNLIHKEGHKIPAEIHSRAYRTSNGELRAVLNFRDISKRKQIENDLIKTRHFTESALNSIPGVFLVLDREGNLVRWNEHMITDLGYTKDELTEKNALDFIIDDEKERLQSKMERCFHEGELSVETKVHARDGGIKDYHLFAKRFEEEGEMFMVGAGIDITDQKQAERNNRKNQLMLQQLFDNAPVGIVISDVNNNIQQVNKSFEKIFQYSQDEAAGKNINRLIVPEDKREEANNISNATFEGDIMQTKSVRLTKDNSEIPVLIGGVPVEYKDEIIAIYGIYVDISKQQQYQNKIEEALQEKDLLLAELHHRVKNNLALIVSLLELQLFDSENQKLDKELTNVKNRILAIASIHEVLYRNGSFNRIPFANFLSHLLETETISSQSKAQKLNLNTEKTNIALCINQSIPAGLLINELLSLIFEYASPEHNQTLSIRLRQYQQQVHIIVEGTDIFTCPKQVRESYTLHNQLIDVLVKQLDGTLVWPTPGSSYQKFELIFSKTNGHSPARDILN